MTATRILVCDDDAWILRMVTTVLEKRGYTVITAADGEEAFRKAQDSRPDLFIIDVMMPKMDGWALIKALRAQPEFAFVPVIFLTALNSDDDRIRGFRLGADDYLPKPFRFEELELRVAKTLRQRGELETNWRQKLSSESGTRAELAGEIDNLGLSAVLVLLEMERKTGILTISRESHDVTMMVRCGHIVKAESSGASANKNEEIIYEVLGWGTGRFEFHSDEIDCDAEINTTTTHILMESARRLDEANRGQ